jgi:hypothetical protein
VVTELSYERDYPPSPASLADAVIAVDDDRDRLSARARERAVSHFDVDRWLARHRAVFTAE